MFRGFSSFSKKIFGVFFAVLVLTLAPAVFASAASAAPGKVKELQADEIKTTSATLIWSKVSGADGYILYRINSETGKRKLITRTTALSYSLKYSRSSKAYGYQVFAYKQKGSSYIEAKKGSPVVEVGPQTLRQLCYGNKSVFLEWDKVNGATAYILYKYNEKKDVYTKVKKLTSTSYQVTGLSVGKQYKFAVCGVDKSGERTSFSNVLTVTGKRVRAISGRRWIAYAKTNIKVQDIETGEKIKILKGDTVYTAVAASGQMKATLPDGRTAMIKGSNLKFDNLVVTKSYKYYSKNQAEAYVNGGGYSSETNWLLWISQYSSSLHFFQGSQGHWKEKRVAPCVIGFQGHTKPGIFHICKYMDGEVYFYWNGNMEWGQAFHWRTDSNVTGAHSSGCIRLGNDDLNFLRANCTMGTTVISF